MNINGNSLVHRIWVVAQSDADMPDAKRIAVELGLDIASKLGLTKANSDDDWQLLVNGNNRVLVRPDGARLSIDFTQGKPAVRQAQASKNQSLVRALGLHKLKLSQRQALHVIDATAGLGQDGWLIASQGCKTTLIEESAVIAYLLNHAVNQATQQGTHANTAHRIDVVNTHCQHYLAQMATQMRPDIIYLDPMFPHKQKKAKVKKGMQFLQALLPETDNNTLLCHALKAAKQRVVVKRPPGAQALAGTGHWAGQLTTVQTNATRFDIYHIAR